MSTKVCSLITAKAGEPQVNGFTLESWLEMASKWDSLITDALDKSQYGEEPKKFLILFKRALQEFGQYMHAKDLKTITKYVEDYIHDPNNFADWIEAYIPQEGLYNAISKKFQAAQGNTLQQYDEDVEQLEDTTGISSKFLDLTFGSNANLKNLVKLTATQKLVNAFIIDREHNRIIANATEANISARNHKQELFDTVCTYLGISKSPLFTADGYYTGAMDSPEFKNAMRDARSFETWTLNDIEKAFSNSDHTNYDAFISWYILTNYDNFVNLVLGDAVKIHPEAVGKLANGDVYGFTDKHGANITSWKTDDNTVMADVVSKLAQALINTTPLYKYGTTNPTGHLLKFEDFYRIITKIKDLVTSSESSLASPLRNTYVTELRQVTEEVGNKSLRQVINEIRLNPIKNIELAMKYILKNPTLVLKYFEDEDADKLYSLYKGIFSGSDNHSINYIQNQTTDGGTKRLYNHNSLDYYSLLTQVADSMFSVGFLQYNDVDGVISVRTLNDLSADNAQRAVEQTINQLNSKRIINDEFIKRQMVPWKAGIIHASKLDDNSKIQGISITIGDLPIIWTNSGKGFFSVTRMDNLIGKVPMKEKDFNAYMEDPKKAANKEEVLKFIETQLGIPLRGNGAMIDALNKEFNGSGIYNLLKLSTVVLFNKYMSNVVAKNATNSGQAIGFVKTAQGITGDSDLIPSYNYDLHELNLVPDAYVPMMTSIAKAKTRVTGEAISTQVKTADGDMLSQQTLSRLIGNITSQWESIRTSGGACSGFALLNPGMYLGHYASKELKSSLGNKGETLFTVAELAQGMFLYDYVAGLMPTTSKSGKDVYGDGRVGFYPSVNSDKGTIGRIIVNLGMPGPNGKAFKDMTINEILMYTGQQLGEAYEKAYDNIKSDYTKLEGWITSQEGINIKLDPNNNFEEFNAYAKSIDKKPAKLLFEWTRKYNNTHPNTPIRLIENVHYVKGSGNDIQFNNTYRALRERYGLTLTAEEEDKLRQYVKDSNIKVESKEALIDSYNATHTDKIIKSRKNLERFMNTKRTELVTALLSEGAEFNLTLEGDTAKNTPKKWLRANYKNWVNIADTDNNGNVFRNIENGRMVIAKLHDHGNTYSITSKQDLAHFAEIVGTTLDDLLNNPHVLLKYGLQVHPLLDQYNAFDYLFTLEFMMAGVGSHIAHPSKTKIKTPIIWGHPAIGKSYALEHGTHQNQFIDWDEEFNEKRDAWFTKVSGIEKYLPDGKKNPDFKLVKNEFLINWRNHDDFKEFVKKCWEETKAKAKAQNKILFASPAMLLEMFPKDFNAVIDMSDEDFINRATDRGDAYPVEWKAGINEILEPIRKYQPSKIIKANPGQYLEDMFNDGSLQPFLDMILDNEIQEEAARFLAQHKRNVSYTAQMQEFQLNQLNGVPSEYNMAMMEDVPANTYTITGDTNTNDSYDGATFVNPYVVYWENNSLNSAKAGIDKKQFVHFYDELTGTGGIVKTAGFGVTNDRMRRFYFYRTMNYNMTARNWFNEDGTQHIMRDGGILKDFEGRDVDYGEQYFKRGNKYFVQTIDSYDGNNTYTVTTTEVDEFGQLVPGAESISHLEIVNSNYDVWDKLFGGMRSMELVDGKLQYSETSIENTAIAASNYGIKYNENKPALTLEDVYQPMKHSDIHYMPTKGAVKQGACNINPWSSFFNKVDGGVNFMKVKMRQAGIQLDKEHHADNAVLSLMTQVISAACSRGLMPTTSTKVYSALYELSKIGTKNFRDELGKLQLGEFGDVEAFDAAVTQVILKTILTSSATDGDMMQAIARDILLQMQKEKLFKFDKESLKRYDTLIPYSSPEIFRKVVTSLTTAMTKRGIKTKMPGVLSVLCPAHEIVKFYKVPVTDDAGNIVRYKRVPLEQFEDAFGIENDEQLQAKLDEIQSNEAYLDSVHDIEIGYKYLVTYDDGSQEVVQIARPNSMNVSDLEKKIWAEGMNVNNLVELGQLLLEISLDDKNNYVLGKEINSKDAKSGKIYLDLSTGNYVRKSDNYLTYQGTQMPSRVIGYTDLKAMGRLQSIQEWARDGLDLHSYQLKFTANGLKYQLGDLDIVQEYFNVKAIDGDDKQLKYILPLIYEKYNKKDEFVQRIHKDLIHEYDTSDTTQVLHMRILEDFVGILGSLTPENYQKAIDHLIDTYTHSDIVQVGDTATNQKVTYGICNSLKEKLYKYLHDVSIGFMNRTMQQSLNAISPSSKDVKAMINGQLVDVDKSSIKTQAFGIIMPKVFKENFGLDTFDAMEDILGDPDFFTKKVIKRFSTKVESYPVDADGSATVNNYDLELKKNDGNHIYIRLDRNAQGQGMRGMGEACDLQTEVLWFKEEDADGKIYRTKEDGTRMYEMFSKEDKIYRDINGVEIIVPSNVAGEYFEDKDGNKYDRSQVIAQANGKWRLKKQNVEVTQHALDPIAFYLNSLKYSNVNISEHSSDAIYNRIMAVAQNSTNKTAVRFYNRITSIGPDVRQLRKRVKKFNNYARALNDQIDGEQLENIRQIGREMMTSFQMARNLVAARIPSQNQQSFMAMEVEALDNPDINTAYVSIFQFYLQGSDLDIDAVSLQVFDIDSDGLFVGHSPYYSLMDSDMRKASEDLPFPTGRAVELGEATGNNLREIISDSGIKYANYFKDALSILRPIYKDHKFVKFEPVLNTVESIKTMAQLIEQINEGGLKTVPALYLNQAFAWFNSYVIKEFQLSSPEEVNEVIRQLKQVVDDHNLYINTLSQDHKEKLVKNYAITQLYNIIIDPINLEESWSSVDTVTAPVKDLAKKSPKATVQNMFSPGNFMNKCQSLSENMVGKDGIAICATGLKSFFGLTLMYQQMLNNPNISASEKDRLLKPVKIGGKVYKGLANAFSPDIISKYENVNMLDDHGNFSEEMYDFLVDQLWASDAANDMSALLGLSADNAKELVLAKINAGTATLGMYLYGMAIGVPMDTLYNIINSKLGRRLTELTKGDYFNGDVGTRNIIGALQYLQTEPRLNKFNIATGDYKIDQPGEFLIKKIRETDKSLQNTKRPILDFCKKFNKSKLEELRSLVKNAVANIKNNPDFVERYVAQYNRAIDAIEQFMDDRALLHGKGSKLYTIYGSTEIYDNLEMLATGAEEMKTCGKILHLNQEIYTTPDKLIDQIHTIEQLINNRNKQVKKQKNRMDPGSGEDAGVYNIDLEKFMTDEDYAQLAIELYDDVMQSFNVLRVIHDDPNYRGYVEALLIAYTGLTRKSTKQVAIIDKAYPFIDQYLVVDPNLQAKVVKNAEAAVDLFTRSKWMTSQKFTITMEPSTDETPSYVFIDNLKTPTVNYVERTIHLGNPMGDANFKLWMERTAIPALKKMYPENKFLKDLTPIIGGTNELGIKLINYGLRINMMPNAKDSYATDLFNQYKESFNDLITKDTYNGHTIQELFYLYSLISYKGKTGPTSLHGIFLDYTGAAVTSYRDFVSLVDKNMQLREELMKFITDDMLAPISTPGRGGSNLIKYVDKNSDTPYLLVNQKDEEGGEDGYYEDQNPEGEEGTSNYIGGYLIRSNQFSGVNTNFFLTSQSVATIDLNTNNQEVDFSTPSSGTLKGIRVEKDGKFVRFQITNIDTGNNDLNNYLRDVLKDVPVIVTKKGTTVNVEPNKLIIEQIIQDFKNNCK